MKFLGILFKKEYIIYYIEPDDKVWFFDEPYCRKKDMAERLARLDIRGATIKIKTRITIEV